MTDEELAAVRARLARNYAIPVLSATTHEVDLTSPVDDVRSLLEEVRHRQRMVNHWRAAYDGMRQDVERLSAGTPPGLEVRLNEDRTVDEVVVSGVHVHVEQMDTNSWWIGISSGDARAHLDFNTKRARITLGVRNEGFPLTITGNGWWEDKGVPLSSPDVDGTR